MSPNVNSLTRSIMELLEKLRECGLLRLDGVLKWEKCECMGGKTKWVKQADITDSAEIDIESIGVNASYERDFKSKYKEVERALISGMYQKLKE